MTKTMKKTMKKMPEVLLAAVLAMAFAFAIGAVTAQEAYADVLGEGVLYVGGQDIVEKGGTVTGDGGQGTAVLSYDEDGNPVLTLTNYKCESCTGGSASTYWSVIQCKEYVKLTVQINGENAVKPADGQRVHDGITCDGPLVMKGDGSLTAASVSGQTTKSIFSGSDIRIESGSITAKTGAYSIYADGRVIISGGTVNAFSGDSDYYTWGIYGTRGVEITGGVVTAKAGNAANCVGIFGDTTIGRGITRVEIIGGTQAVEGTVKNAVPGKGWDNTEGTGDGTPIRVNTEGTDLKQYKKLVFDPAESEKLYVRITGNSDTVTYNADEQTVSGFAAEYKVGEGDWTTDVPEDVSVNLKSGVAAEAKGTNVDTYVMGLTADSFDINPGYYYLDEVTIIDGTLTIEKAPLTITAKDQTYVYNGYEQGEGDPAYDDPAVIAKKVTASGLQGNDVLTSLVMTGTAKEIGVYPGRIQATSFAVGNATRNYAITYVDGTLTITPIPLAVTVGGSSAKKVYNGKQQTYKGTVTAKSSDPAFDASKFLYKGSTVVKGTKAGVYTTKLAANGCVYSDPLYELKVTIGSPVKLTITGEPVVNKAAAKIALDAGVIAKSSGSKVTASWGAVKGASSYVLYANYCDQKKLKKIKTVSGKTTSFDITKLNGKKFNPKKNLKFYVVAYQTVKGKKIKLAKSIMAHAPGSKNTKRTNVTGVKVKKASFKLKKGKTAKIKAKLILQKKSRKPLKHEAKFRYASSNKKVAKVSKKGKITAVGKGKCTVYVYAVSGVSKKIKVTVK